MTTQTGLSLPAEAMPATAAWLSRKQAAEYMQISVPTLARWAMLEIGVPFSKFGGVVRYKKSDCDDFMDSHKVTAQ